jgi:hypothetical protein
MAIVFELVVDFAENREAAERAAQTARAEGSLRAGEHELPVLALVARFAEGQVELSVIPLGINVNLPADKGYPRVRLAAGELTELAQGLYRLLARFDGYRAAAVDWDPEHVVECADLEEDYGDQLVEGYPHGLVLAEGVRRRLSADAARPFEPFAPGFDWIPYRGHQSGTY